MPKPVLFGLRGLQNEENVVAASRHLTPICRGKWRSLGEDIGTTDLLAHNQNVVGTFLRCKLLALKKWSGRMDLNHRPPGPEPGALARLRYAPTDNRNCPPQTSHPD